MKLKDITPGETYRINSTSRYSAEGRGGIAKVAEDQTDAYLTNRWGRKTVRGVRVIWTDKGKDTWGEPFAGQEVIVTAQRVIATEADWKVQQKEEEQAAVRQELAAKRRKKEQAKTNERLMAECEELGIPYREPVVAHSPMKIEMGTEDIIKLVRAAKEAGADIEIEEVYYGKVTVKDTVAA